MPTVVLGIEGLSAVKVIELPLRERKGVADKAGETPHRLLHKKLSSIRPAFAKHIHLVGILRNILYINTIAILHHVVHVLVVKVDITFEHIVAEVLVNP